MDDDDQPHSRLRHSTTMRTSFSVPITRCPSRILASSADRRILLSGGSSGDDLDFFDETCSLSKPILILDVLWNTTCVAASLFALVSTPNERPSKPLRFWLFGYALQCLLHVLFVCSDYLRRSFVSNLFMFSGVPNCLTHSGILKKLEVMITVIYSGWWMLGLYWILLDNQRLNLDSPHLYWITIIFLATDVFFLIFCIAMVMVIFITCFFFVPVVSFAYSVVIRDGASADDIRNLPKYRFHQDNENDNERELRIAQLESGNNNHIKELVLNPEDSECSICLTRYVDGAELSTLPCSHHFHCRCISKWLQISATCPLCKFNILGNDSLV